MKRYFTFIVAALMFVISCGENPTEQPDPAPKPTPENPTPEDPTPEDPTPEDPAPSEQQEIKLNFTHIDENMFGNGDTLGIYVVNRTNSFDNPLLDSGNYVDNVCMTYYDGSWNSDSILYWYGDNTRADVYCYAPYIADIKSVKKCPISVKADQREPANLRASDILWGMASNWRPSFSSTVDIKMSHITSCLVVMIEPGNGFTYEELKDVDVIFYSCPADIDLSNGTITLHDEINDVIASKTGDGYMAYVMPRSFNNEDFVKVIVDGNTYVLKQTLTLVMGKVHYCTITLAKINQGVNIGISDWVVDPNDYGGVLE